MSKPAPTKAFPGFAMILEPWRSLVEVATKHKLPSLGSALVLIKPPTALDPSVVTAACIESLGHLFSCRSHNVPYKLETLACLGTKDDGTANTALDFLLNSCAYFPGLDDEYADFLVRSISSFCHKLSHYSHLDLWKALVLALMAVAVRLPAGTSLVAQLRNLNGKMQLKETVTYSASSFHGVPPTCAHLVACGLGLQACLDVEDGASLSGVKLEDAFVMAEGLFDMFLNHGSAHVYLLKCFPFLSAALKSCRVQETDSFVLVTSKLLAGMVAARERAHADAFLHQGERERDLENVELDPRGATSDPVIDDDAVVMKESHDLLLQISDVLSLPVLTRVWRAVLRLEARSRMLPLVLSLLNILVEAKWPQTADGAECNGLLELRGILDDLFVSKAVSFYVLGPGRNFKEQLVSVQEAVRMYIVLIHRDVQGKTNLSGLLDEQALEYAADKWLWPLCDQADAADVKDGFNRRKHEYTLCLVKYALRVNEKPELVLVRGLPPW